MTRRLMTRLVAISALAACGALTFVASAPRAALAGDAKVADSLMKSGKQALSKGDASGAIAFFKKAQEETPELIEALWWRGSAQEKSGDKVAALASYREYQAAFDEKNKSGASMSKEEQRLKALADKSVEALAAGEKEFRKLEDSYVAALLTLAKDNFVRDPGISRKAVAAILAVRPDHDEALKLDAKLGGGADGGARAQASEVGPFKEVKTWRDLIADKSFRSDSVDTPGSGMFVDTPTGKAVTPAGFIDTGASFAIENEFRFSNVYDQNWATGIGVGWKSGNFVAALVLPGRIVISRFFANGKHDDLAQQDIAAVDVKAWHRLGAIVKGPSIEVWFDGKSMASWKNPSGEDLVGDPVIMQERCKTEWRIFHTGKLD